MHINHLQAQLLAEMDEEFGISNLVEEEFGSLSRPRQPVRNDEKIFSVTLLSQNSLNLNSPLSQPKDISLRFGCSCSFQSL